MYAELQRHQFATIGSLVLNLIVDRELHSPWAVDAFLIHRFLLDLVPSLCRDKEPHFYCRHLDDQGDHIMVDDNFNIAGIIDWEWAYTAAAEMAFISPTALWDVSADFSGVGELSDKEWVFAELLYLHQSMARFVRVGGSSSECSFVPGTRCMFGIEWVGGFVGSAEEDGWCGCGGG